MSVLKSAPRRLAYPGTLAWLTLASLSLTGLACAHEPPAGKTDTAAALLPPIHALIGDAACDTDAQCRSIGVGAKACGGPNGYLAWSARGTNEAALRAAVEQQARVQRAENERSGMSSNCMVVPDPGARCLPSPQGGQCRLNSSGRLGAQ